MSLFIGGIEVPIFKAYSHILTLQNTDTSNFNPEIFEPEIGNGEQETVLFADVTEPMSKLYFDNLYSLALQDRITLKFVPFIETRERPNSLDAAAAQYCAGEQQFFQFTEELFGVNNNDSLFFDRLIALYSEAGLGNTDQFRACLASNVYQNHILTLQDDAEYLGALTAPFLTVDGEEVSFESADQIEEFFQS
jgi:protein-disulfide isomerase